MRIIRDDSKSRTLFTRCFRKRDFVHWLCSIIVKCQTSCNILLFQLASRRSKREHLFLLRIFAAFEDASEVNARKQKDILITEVTIEPNISAISRIAGFTTKIIFTIHCSSFPATWRSAITLVSACAWSCFCISFKQGGFPIDLEPAMLCKFMLLKFQGYFPETFQGHSLERFALRLPDLLVSSLSFTPDFELP